MRHAPALAAALCGLILLGCPGPSSGTGGGQAPVGGEGPALQDPDAPTEDPVTPAPDGSTPAPTTWTLISAEAEEELAWPLLEPVRSWPAPSALRDLGEDAPAVAERAALLRQLTETLIRPDLHPSNVDAALKRDAEGRLHLTIGRARPQGSASLDSHGADFPPVFVVALEKPGPRAEAIGALREAVAQVVVPDLARELAQEGHRLEPHPQAKGAGLAFLDRSGFGAQFPYLYAYSSDDHLLLVFQEVPHGKAPEPR